MPISTAGKTPSRPGRQRGFTYALVLVAIFLLGIASQRAETSNTRRLQVDREQELLFRGLAYRQAIAQFHAALGRYPRTLDELLKDPRGQRPYLRQLYRDPMAEPTRDLSGAAAAGWRLMRAADGGIVGVASSSTQEPIKKANFPPGLEAFEDARSYAQWVFEHKALRPRTPALARRMPCERPGLTDVVISQLVTNNATADECSKLTDVQSQWRRG